MNANRQPDSLSLWHEHIDPVLSRLNPLASTLDADIAPSLLPILSTSADSTSQAQTSLNAFDWKRTINDTYFDLNVSFRQPNKFLGFLQHAKLLDIGVSHYHANTVHYDRGAQSADYDDSILITFPLTGDVRFIQKNRSLSAKPGQFFIELSNLPYEFYHLHEVSLYVIKVPLALLRAQSGTIERQFARSLSIDEGAGRLLVFQMKQILTLIHHQKLADLEIKILEQQLLNLIVLTLSAPKEVMMSEMSAIQSVHLKRIENYVNLNLANPDLSPKTVAAACHISVRYLHKLFASLPYSFSEWVKMLRLKQANHILKSKSYVTIEEVAHRVGYGDQSYFSRIYKQYFGYSPRDTPSTG